MGDYEEEVVESKLVDRFTELGLSEYEAHTLVALVRLGTATAKEIADADHVPRTRVYDAVDALHDRGLVDIQYTTPRKFTVVSLDSIVRKLDTERRNTITEIAEFGKQLPPSDSTTEEVGAWTVTDRDAVAGRVFEFVDEADDEIIYMTVDELLTDEHLDHLQAADERGVTVYLAGISGEVQERIQTRVPDAELFETLWEWADTPAGRLLVTDRRTALVSVRTRNDDGSLDETAVWGSGERNSLVVVLRAIFTWRLENAI